VRKEGNGGLESGEGIEGAFSIPGFTDFGAVSFGSASGNGEGGTGDTGGELFTSPDIDPGRADPGDGSSETKRGRGRPKGSTNAATKSKPAGRTKLSDAELRAARDKLAESLAGGVGFGFSYYGTIRANKYKNISPLLANRVYSCYQIPAPAAMSIGEPLADTFMTWFPQYVKPVSDSIDPALAIGRLISVLQQTAANERMVVMQFQQEVNTPQNQPGSNGVHPPTPEDLPEDNFTEWHHEQAPTPQEVLQTPQTHIPTSS
jgi:hypothetical protein